MIFEEASDETDILPSIKLVGVGGAGINILTQIHHKTSFVDFIAMDSADNTLECGIWTALVRLGNDPKSLGCGANPEKGRLAALKSIPAISDSFQRADMIILVAGLGGGIGSGALPIIANIAKQICSVVVCFTVMPFPFEGKKRTLHALDAYQRLQEERVAIVMLSNKQFLQHFSPRTPLIQIMAEVGLQLTSMINNFIGIITSTSLINIDFADMKTILSAGGHMFIGSNSETSEIGSDINLDKALKNEILEAFDFSKSNRSILLIEAGDSFDLGTLYDVGEALASKSDIDIELIMGVNLMPDMSNEIRVTLFMLGDFTVLKTKT
jgi:cell division protein FtsZ